MNKIYIGQTNLNIVVTVNAVLTGATQTRIAYRNPNGVVGHFNASVTNGAGGVMSFAATNNELNIAGTWTFWADVILSNGLRSIGTTFEQQVFEAGN